MPDLIARSACYATVDLDHPADVQLHSWGPSLQRAFELVAEAMFGYMVELDSVDVDDAQEAAVEADGHDLDSLLFNLLDELLFQFNTEGMVCKELRLSQLSVDGPFSARGVVRGEKFVRGRHRPGTEVKAVTYSAMQIVRTEEYCETFVIVDI